MSNAPTRRHPLRTLLPGLLALAAASAVAAPSVREVHDSIAKGKPFDAHVAEEAGRKGAFFCANCHGEVGMSKYPEVPNLAGQHPVYLQKQIDAFLSGARKNDFMQGLVKVLSVDDRANIVAFYSAQAVTPLALPGPRAAEGQALFLKNCARCHGSEARGGDTLPRLAGQQSEYLRLNLNRYLKQTGDRIYPPMTAAVAGLGEKNIEAVVDYLSSLK